MRIEAELRFDFDDVLIRPKRSVALSRASIEFKREYRFQTTPSEQAGQASRSSPPISTPWERCGWRRPCMTGTCSPACTSIIRWRNWSISSRTIQRAVRPSTRSAFEMRTSTSLGRSSRRWATAYDCSASMPPTDTPNRGDPHPSKMECTESKTAQDWQRIADTLAWAKAHLRQPRINCLETWYHQSRDDLNLMRATTTLALTHSDGYCLFSDPNPLPTPDHLHDWYSFWNKSLGRPVGKGNANSDGTVRREFENGTVVYNPNSLGTDASQCQGACPVFRCRHRYGAVDIPIRCQLSRLGVYTGTGHGSGCDPHRREREAVYVGRQG